MGLAVFVRHVTRCPTKRGSKRAGRRAQQGWPAVVTLRGSRKVAAKLAPFRARLAAAGVIMIDVGLKRREWNKRPARVRR